MQRESRGYASPPCRLLGDLCGVKRRATYELPLPGHSTCNTPGFDYSIIIGQRDSGRGNDGRQRVAQRTSSAILAGQVDHKHLQLAASAQTDVIMRYGRGWSVVDA